MTINLPPFSIKTCQALDLAYPVFLNYDGENAYLSAKTPSITNLFSSNLVNDLSGSTIVNCLASSKPALARQVDGKDKLHYCIPLAPKGETFRGNVKPSEEIVALATACQLFDQRITDAQLTSSLSQNIPFYAKVEVVSAMYRFPGRNAIKAAKIITIKPTRVEFLRNIRDALKDSVVSGECLPVVDSGKAIRAILDSVDLEDIANLYAAFTANTAFEIAISMDKEHFYFQAHKNHNTYKVNSLFLHRTANHPII